MCFSTGASFGASVVLSVIGVAVLKKVKAPHQVPFASIPLIFAVQQFSEGFVWLYLSNPVFAWAKASPYLFLTFAQIVWPLWVPVSIAILEPDVKRKKVLNIFIGVGLLVSTYFAHRLWMYGVHPNIEGYHIAYQQIYPDSLSHVADILYGVATLVPIFLSKIKRMWTFGLAVFVAYLVTYIFYVNYILSVWCFFSAVMSVLIYFITQGMESTRNPGRPGRV
jgi:hypothetical protein